MSQTKAIVDKLLTGVSSRVMPVGHICEQLLPFVGVVQDTGSLAKYGKEHLRIETSITGGRGAYRRVEATTRSQSTYKIEGHGLEAIVTKADYRNVEAPYDAEADEVLGLTTKLLTEKEYSLADVLADTAVLTQNTTLSGTSQFSDLNNSNPLNVFKTARAAVRAGCGMVPNAAWMDYDVADALRYHPQLLDNLGFKDNRPGGLQDSELAKALGVRKLLIAEAVYNSAKEGQTDVLANIWGKHIWFGVLPDQAMPGQVSLGYRLGFKGQQPRKVYRTANFNPPGSNLILVEDEYDHFLTDVGAAYLIKDAIA